MNEKIEMISCLEVLQHWNGGKVTIFLFFTVKGTATEQNRWLAHSWTKLQKSAKNKILKIRETYGSLELNHLAAILHVHVRSLIFMK